MSSPEILTVKKATYLDNYRIKVYFSNHVNKVVDFSELIATGKGVCKKMADLNYFKSFQLDPFTIDWQNEIGFSPEFLYEKGMQIDCDTIGDI